ncbi:MAG: enoyl-CoA hydratase/isomerase family protein [Hyphomicrobiales bacterium]|nr:enoyl-CoA hydratase/isomerase family protein [Hyphomicrobiales bacterium]MBV9752512.1 enoyl-CoA hydratase/isomerase family protein [Hyphomicrobiales bacterium]
MSPTTVTSDDPRILFEVDAEGIGVVRIARPEKRNAVSLSMWMALGAVFAASSVNQAVRCLILTGSGGHFSAGADISEFGKIRAGAEAARHYDELCDKTTLAIRDCPKPVIAALSGVTVGGGLGLALACDLRVADETIRTGIPAGKLGLVYSVTDCRLLAERVGVTKAKEILFTARIFGLEDALRLGLVDRAVKTDAFGEARKLAAEIASNAPLSLAGSKAILNAVSSGTAKAQDGELQRLIDAAFDSADYTEGVRAFGEGRSPRFTGR